MGNITFEQLPQAVSILIEKVGQLTDKVEMALGKTPQQHDEKHHLLSLKEVAALLGKSASTIYAMTSDKRIPYHKRGTSFISLKMKSSAGLNRAGLREHTTKTRLTGGLKNCAAAKAQTEVVAYKRTITPII